MSEQIHYRGFIIEPNRPPYGGAWEYVHDDYDGAPDAYDHRYGYAPTLEEAREAIDEMIEDEGVIVKRPYGSLSDVTREVGEQLGPDGSRAMADAIVQHWRDTGRLAYSGKEWELEEVDEEEGGLWRILEQIGYPTEQDS